MEEPKPPSPPPTRNKMEEPKPPSPPPTRNKMEEPKPPSPPPTTTRANSKNEPLPNFRSLVLQFVMASAPNLLSQKDQIEQRIQELVPSCPTPHHPTYNWMIENAITQLNDKRGSSAESISKFILRDHKDLLPWSHTTVLKHHLKILCERGFLSMNNDGLYVFRKQTNEPFPKPDPDQSSDYGFESDSTSSSGESFSPIKEREMIKQLEDNTVGKRIRRKGKSFRCKKQSRKWDSVVGMQLEEESGVDEEMIDEPQIILSENSISRVRTGKQGQNRKRGRPRKNIITSLNQIPKPVAEEAIMGQYKVVADKQNQHNEDQGFCPQIEVYTVDSDDTANVTRVEQSDEDIEDMDLIIDQVYVEENETQSFTIEDKVIHPQTEEQHRVQVDKDLGNGRCQVDPSTMVTDIFPEEQKRELGMDKTESLQKDVLLEETGQSMYIREATGIQILIEAIDFEKANQYETIDFVNSNYQAADKTVAKEIALEKQEHQVSMEKTESLQNHPRNVETRMNAPHDVNDQSVDDQVCLMDDVGFQERESDVIGVENHLRDACKILEERDKQVITEQNQPEAQQCDMSMERTESLQKHVHVEETAKNMNLVDANGVQDLIEELEFENENHNDLNETMDLANGDSQSEPSTLAITVALEEKEHQISMEMTKSLQKDTQKEVMYVTVAEECGKERGTNELIASSQTCLTNGVKCQERDSDVTEDENHLKYACEISEEQDEQAITRKIQPEEHECEVIMERTSQNYAHIEETGKHANETESFQVCCLSREEQKFEKENQIEPTEVTECDKDIECYVNEQSGKDQTCEVNDAELQKQYAENRFSGETKEENHWEDACEFVEEQDQHAITEQYQPDNEEHNILDDRCKQGIETGNEQSLSQKPQEDGEGGSQQSEEQKQELEKHDEYENLDAARCVSEIERNDASQKQEENEDMNQQMKEQRRDACPSQLLQKQGCAEYENLDQAQQLLEKENIYDFKQQQKNEDVNQHLNELKQAAKIDGDKGMAEGMMGIEILVEYGVKSRESMLECEQNSVSNKMELENHCIKRTNSLELRSDTSSAKKSSKVKALNVVQQVDKRQLRPRPNKAQSIVSEGKGNIFVPSQEKSSETNPHKKLRVTKWLEQGTRRSARLQKSRSGN